MALGGPARKRLICLKKSENCIYEVSNLKGSESGINEARLYCNLIRSYLTYLIAEHERISDPAA